MSKQVMALLITLAAVLIYIAWIALTIRDRKLGLFDIIGALMIAAVGISMAFN